MSRRFQTEKFWNHVQIPTSTATVITPNIDISNYESFSLLYQNSHTGIGFIHMQLQGAYDSSATAADQAPNWFNIPSTTIAQPSALGATANAWTTQVSPNTLKWLRVIGAMSATAAIGVFKVTVAGSQRN
jgi:hypothetical protein